MLTLVWEDFYSTLRVKEHTDLFVFRLHGVKSRAGAGRGSTMRTCGSDSTTQAEGGPDFKLHGFHG